MTKTELNQLENNSIQKLFPLHRCCLMKKVFILLIIFFRIIFLYYESIKTQNFSTLVDEINVDNLFIEDELLILTVMELIIHIIQIYF